MCATVPTNIPGKPSALQAPERQYIENARELLQKRLAESPDWLQDLRLRALSRFEVLGFPTRRLEAWKAVNLRPLLAMPLENKSQEAKVCPPAIHRHLIDDADVTRLVFCNGRFNESLSTPIKDDSGLIVTNLGSALEAYPELVKNALAQGLETETDAFAALNLALFKGGSFVYLPDGAQFKGLLQIVYAHFDEIARGTHPRNLVIAGKNSAATMVIEHLGLSQAGCFNNTVNEIILDTGASVNATLLLSEGPNSWHLASTNAVLQTDATLSMDTVTLSGHVNRHSVRSLIKGEGASVNLNGLDVLTGKTEIYHHTVTEHWVGNSASSQFYKGILDDATKSEFNSLVFVAKGADGTDSQQLNKTLLLSNNARVSTRPQLQINADDVKCAHGAAVGQLAEDQLFYLASRGLDMELAQALLTYGFAEDVIQRIADPRVRKYLDARVLANLHRTDPALRQEIATAPMGPRSDNAPSRL